MLLALGSGLGLTHQTPNWLDAYRSGSESAVLVMNFKTEQYHNVTQQTLADLTTFTRATSATYIDSSGALATAAINVVRITHDPSTLVKLGYLVEGDATNQLLNSASLSTQNVTVTAVEQTLHFTGTGTITLTGVSTSGPLVGTGVGESNRVSLTFTPTAGTLTCTVSGTVSNAQLETGGTVTSYIATAGTAVTRQNDVLTIDDGAVPFVGFSGTEGTWRLKAKWVYRTGSTVGILAGRANNGIVLQTGSSSTRIRTYDGTALPSVTGVFTDDTDISVVMSYKEAGSFNILADGGSEGTGSLTGDLVTSMVDVGHRAGIDTMLSGVIEEIVWWPTQYSLAVRQGLST